MFSISHRVQVCWDIYLPHDRSMGLVYIATWIPYKSTIHVGEYRAVPWICHGCICHKDQPNGFLNLPPVNTSVLVGVWSYKQVSETAKLCERPEVVLKFWILTKLCSYFACRNQVLCVCVCQLFWWCLCSLLMLLFIFIRRYSKNGHWMSPLFDFQKRDAARRKSLWIGAGAIFLHGFG